MENEELGHYDIPNSISMDKLFDEFNMEVGTSPSAEDILLGDDDQDLDDMLSTFAELVTSLIAKSPKIGYAVLLLHSKVKGEEFYKRIRLTRGPANRIRKQAEIILEEQKALEIWALGPRLHTAAFFFYPEIRCGVSHRWVQRISERFHPGCCRSGIPFSPPPHKWPGLRWGWYSCGVSHRGVQRVGIAYLINDFGEGFVRRFKSLIGYSPHKNVSKSKPVSVPLYCINLGTLSSRMLPVWNPIFPTAS